jgi:hypothetical protein
MEKTLKFVEEELNKYDGLYWEVEVKLSRKEEELQQLQSAVNYMKLTLEEYRIERDKYQDLFNELNGQ